MMIFQDVAFLPYRTMFSTSSRENCGRGICLGTTTYLKAVVGGKPEHAPCVIVSLHEASFVCL